MVKNRLLFTLLMQNGTYMLSRNFRLQAVGDLDWIKECYDFEAIAYSIDELVVLNVTRGEKNIKAFGDHVSELVRNCMIPIACGGGLRSMDDAFSLLVAGRGKLGGDTPRGEEAGPFREIFYPFATQCAPASNAS